MQHRQDAYKMQLIKNATYKEWHCMYHSECVHPNCIKSEECSQKQMCTMLLICTMTSAHIECIFVHNAKLCTQNAYKIEECICIRSGTNVTAVREQMSPHPRVRYGAICVLLWRWREACRVTSILVSIDVARAGA